MLKGNSEQRAWAALVAFFVGRDALRHANALEALLEDEVSTVRSYAGFALIAMGRADKVRQRWLRGNSLRRRTDDACMWLTECGRAPSDVSRVVREELRGAKGMRRVELAACLWHIGGKVVGRVRALDTRQAGLDVLIGSVKSEDSDVRACAMRAIKEIGPEASRAVPALIGRLRAKAPFPEEHLQTAQALGAIGPAAWPAEKWLCSLLERGDVCLQFEVACALHRIKSGHPAAVGTLQRLIRGRCQLAPGDAVEFLGEMGKHARPATPQLVRLLRHAEIGLSAKASTALWKIDPALARKVGAW
jgi:HEAT repeat protein